MMKKYIHPIEIQVIQKPERKVIFKRGINATDFDSYHKESGEKVRHTLMALNTCCDEPIYMWLPSWSRTSHTSGFVLGVEVPPDYHGPIPNGYDVILLPAAEYLMLQGEPFSEKERAKAIAIIHDTANRYDPADIGYEWDDTHPRIQLEPRGERGCIELRGIKRIPNFVPKEPISEWD